MTLGYGNLGKPAADDGRRCAARRYRAAPATEISTRMPRPDEVSRLRLRPGVPVLDVLHTGVDRDGEPYEVGSALA